MVVALGCLSGILHDDSMELSDVPMQTAGGYNTGGPQGTNPHDKDGFYYVEGDGGAWIDNLFDAPNAGDNVSYHFAVRVVNIESSSDGAEHVFASSDRSGAETPPTGTVRLVFIKATTTTFKIRLQQYNGTSWDTVATSSTTHPGGSSTSAVAYIRWKCKEGGGDCAVYVAEGSGSPSTDIDESFLSNINLTGTPMIQNISVGGKGDTGDLDFDVYEVFSATAANDDYNGAVGSLHVFSAAPSADVSGETGWGTDGCQWARVNDHYSSVPGTDIGSGPSAPNDDHLFEATDKPVQGTSAISGVMISVLGSSTPSFLLFKKSGGTKTAYPGVEVAFWRHKFRRQTPEGDNFTVAIWNAMQLGVRAHNEANRNLVNIVFHVLGTNLVRPDDAGACTAAAAVRRRLAQVI